MRVDLDSLNRAADERPLAPEHQPSLVALTTEHAGRVFPIERATVHVGRTEDNDIAIDHRSMSRQHCRIFLDKDGLWKIADLGSANGVRVNGEEYGLIDLRRGDVIELGHVKLRFCEPGEHFEFTEEIAAAYASAPVADARAAGGKKSRLPLLLVALGIAAGIGVVVFFLLPEPETPSAPPSPPPVAAAAGTKLEGERAKKLERLLADATLAEGADEWEKARAKLEEALRLDPDSKEIEARLGRAEAEAKAYRHLQAGRRAVEAGDWSRALSELEAIPDDSRYYPDAQEQLPSARVGFIDERLRAGQKGLRTKHLDDAEAAAQEVLEVDPENEEAKRILELVDARRSRSERPTGTHDKRRKGKRESARRETAVSSLPQPANDKVARARALRLAGLDAFKRQAYEESIKKLKEAFRIDPEGQKDVHKVIGSAYASLGDVEQAAHHYRLFLKLNPYHRDASRVQQILRRYDAQKK
ncbi:MAG: FHA domain-containing protein [Deltaproteobacteria bacterium]|nr:MAG: FHA domain-containing protein [Deltaproteobacteria bacterium]